MNVMYNYIESHSGTYLAILDILRIVYDRGISLWLNQEDHIVYVWTDTF